MNQRLMNQRFLVLSFVVGFGIVISLLFGLRGRSLAQVEAAADASQTTAIPATQVVTSTLIITPTVIPAFALDATDGPTITHGPLSGEVTAVSVVLWARGSISGTLTFVVVPASVGFEDTDEGIETAVTIDEAGDYIGEVVVDSLEAATTYAYQATLTTDDESSDLVQGVFTTAPAADNDASFNFVFGSCLGGQGFCRDPETGWLIFDTMLSQSPDFFLITGDSVYVDSACSVPQNVAGAEEVASDLAGYRSRYRYHLADPHYATFLAQTPVYVTWDDHEIQDDFGGISLSQSNSEQFAEGRQAFYEYWPLPDTAADNPIYRSFTYGAHAEIILLDTRSYRDPNVNWDPHPVNITPKTMLGAEQFTWLQETLSNTDSTWKFIVTSTPLSYPTGFPQPQVDGRDGWANYTEKSGYETELMALIFYIESQDIENVVFLTGDTHWPFAISYDPDRDGMPNFYEFGSSPLSAIVLPPVEKPDPTFNPTVIYAEGEFQGTLFNFGHIAVDNAGNLTFRIIDREGTEMVVIMLEPERPLLADTE
ncbi:MAG: hypothetical protein GY805_19085 [Chloroflexi bacterium]|nr:hypothetical protein [Chloroflexota bacterium]